MRWPQVPQDPIAGLMRVRWSRYAKLISTRGSNLHGERCSDCEGQFCSVFLFFGCGVNILASLFISHYLPFRGVVHMLALCAYEVELRAIRAE
eukprot:3927326-Amphidinium_carterae.1